MLPDAALPTQWNYAMILVVSKKMRPSRRVFVASLGSLFFTSACETKSMQVVLNIVVLSYWHRPIFAVKIDGKGDEASAAYPILETVSRVACY
jgi:hypothetical protein